MILVKAVMGDALKYIRQALHEERQRRAEERGSRGAGGKIAAGSRQRAGGSRLKNRWQRAVAEPRRGILRRAQDERVPGEQRRGAK